MWDWHLYNGEVERTSGMSVVLNPLRSQHNPVQTQCCSRPVVQNVCLSTVGVEASTQEVQQSLSSHTMAGCLL